MRGLITLVLLAPLWSLGASAESLDCYTKVPNFDSSKLDICRVDPAKNVACDKVTLDSDGLKTAGEISCEGLIFKKAQANDTGDATFVSFTVLT